jgi:hypothetical protein
MTTALVAMAAIRGNSRVFCTGVPVLRGQWWFCGCCVGENLAAGNAVGIREITEFFGFGNRRFGAA